MKPLKKLFLCLFFVFAAGAAFCAAVTVYHTNDAHAYYYPRVIDGKLTGGYATLAGFLANRQKPYLLFDGGDFAAGTYEAKESRGLLSVRLMNMLGYNAATIGNHEGDFGEDALLKIIDEAKFPLLAANIWDKQTGAPLPKILPYKIYDISGKKIAVIGLAREPLPSSKKIKTGRDITSIKRALKEAKLHNPDAVILLAHSSPADGYEKKSQELVKSVARMGGIDLMLGGHVHKIVQNKKINNTVFVESGANLKGLSEIILNFDDATGRLADIKTRYITLDAAKYPQDAEIKKYADKFYNGALDAELGRAKETIHKYNPGGDPDIDSPQGNLITDIIKRRTGADIALYNTEGMRADIPQGALTQRLVFDLFPFPDKVVLVKVDGNFIKKLARQAVRKDMRSAFQYSGLNFEFTVQNGSAQITEIFVNGQPLEAPKIYTLAVTDFTASGRAGGHMFKNLAVQKIPGNAIVRDMFLDELKANPQGISAPPTGRIKKI